MDQRWRQRSWIISIGEVEVYEALLEGSDSKPAGEMYHAVALGDLCSLVEHRCLGLAQRYQAHL